MELRDGDSKRFNGLGVLKAIDNVRSRIAPPIVGMSALDQSAIDRKMLQLDATPNKSRLGANAILSVSLATAHAAANFLGIPLYRHLGGATASTLPVPMMNILNGGKHAAGSTNFQEFMIVPAGADSFAHAIQMGVEIYHSLRRVLKQSGLNTNVGDEGGFAPALHSNREAVELVFTAIGAAGYKPGTDCFIALDVAASEFYQDGKYMPDSDGLVLTSEQLVNYYATLAEALPLISIEDGLAEDDWEGWKLLMTKLGEKIQVVGDDLYVTSTHRLQQGITARASNSVLIKLNQVGTLSETTEAIKMAQQAGWTAIVSHRSGETEDATIADLAVAMNTGLIKTGAPCRSERCCKYNRLLHIEEELSSTGHYAGMEAFRKLVREK